MTIEPNVQKEELEAKIFAWAERRLNLPAGTVTNVDFGVDNGYDCCSSYSSPGVYVFHSPPLTGRQRKPRYEERFIGLGGESLIDIILEIKQ